MYLISIGIFLFINDFDIYVGFLWVIDFGVGLIFFVFILHFTNFLYQKTEFNVSSRSLIYTPIMVIFIISMEYVNPFNNSSDNNNARVFNLTHHDYYKTYTISEVTELNILKESYFGSNAFEFFIINFSLFFGLVSSIILFFLIKEVFKVVSYSQIKDLKVLNKISSNTYIRNQNLNKQLNTLGSSKT